MGDVSVNTPINVIWKWVPTVVSHINGRITSYNVCYTKLLRFIRIKDGKNPLDNSAVHPESYKMVEKMAKDLGIQVSELIGNKEQISKIQVEKYTTEDVGILGVQDIVKELEKPGLDPRKAAKVFEFDPSVRSIARITSYNVCYTKLLRRENQLF